MPVPKDYKKKLVLYSPTEWAKVCENAKKANMRTGTYIRLVSVDERIINIDIENFSTIHTAINRVGTNINQIVKVANSTNSIYKKDVEDMQKQIGQLTRFIMQLANPDYEEEN